MRKYLPLLFAIIFLAATGLIISVSIDYYKAHNKNIGEVFLVDSIIYELKRFSFLPMTNSMQLVVDLTIENPKDNDEHFKKEFFAVKGDQDKLYFPLLESFTVFGHEKQQITFTYYLPERRLPTVSYDLIMKSNSDSNQDALLVFAKRYRSKG